MVYLLIWFIFGIISAIIGSNKGRSGFGWFLIVLLFGPFGVIIALVVSKNEEVIEEESIKSVERKICPFCAELIKREAINCRYCNSDLEDTIKINKSLSPNKLTERGYTSYKSGNFSEAIKFLTQAINIDPEYAQSYFIRGGAFYKLKNIENAKEDFEKATNLGHNKTQQLLEKLNEESPTKKGEPDTEWLKTFRYSGK